MSGEEQIILNTDDIGTSKREITSMKKEQEVKVSHKPNLKKDTQRVLNWMDANVLPLVALVIISGLAVRGLQMYLPEMSDTTRLVASIIGVSVLVVKLKSEYNK